MPRTARVLPEEGFLHVFTRGNNKRYIFRKDRDFKIYLELLKKYKERFGLIIYHYALMSNHIHLLCKICAGTNLGKLMQGLGLSYSNRYRKRYEFTGQFWQGRYKSNVIENDEYFLRCGLYIERNPVDAGLVKRPELYQWSSYGAYAFGKKDYIIDRDPLFETLEKNDIERRKVYIEMMNSTLKKFKDARIAKLELLGLQLEYSK